MNSERSTPLWLHKIFRSDFYIKLTNWEYWPFGVIQFPLFFYYPWLSLRARSFTFFCGSNPGITMGGMFGESKFEVLSKLPSTIVPKCTLILQPLTSSELLTKLKDAGLTFPLIFKPDLGERGFMVKRIDNEEQADAYLKSMPHNFLAQQFVDLSEEFGVFYKRYPNETTGTVTSIVQKEMLYVIGDGRSTLQHLILTNDRAKLQWNRLKLVYSSRLDEIIPEGKKLEIVSIGNHCLGTKFINANHLINDELTKSFDKISRQIDGFYFGRFDLRCASINDLTQGNVVVLELNGCGAEPAHIYDPQFSLPKAVFTLIDHWKTIFEISIQNRSRGFQFLPLKEAISHYKNFRNKVS